MDPFATLGLARRYDLDPVELESRYRQLQKTLHPDRNVGAPASERRMTLGKAVEVNEAYRVLRDDLSRAEALLVLWRAAVEGPKTAEPADPGLLMEVMELREALSEAKHAHDAAAVRKLGQQVLALHDKARAALETAFSALSDATAASSLVAVSALVSRLKYYRRFLDEVRAIEEEAQA